MPELVSVVLRRNTTVLLQERQIRNNCSYEQLLTTTLMPDNKAQDFGRVTVFREYE